MRSHALAFAVRRRDYERLPNADLPYRYARFQLSMRWILDGGIGFELYVVELTVLPFDLAQIDFLHYVGGRWIDADRPARAFPLHSFHRLDQRGAVGCPFGGGEPAIDQRHAVISRERHNIGSTIIVRLAERGHKGLVFL